MSDTVHFKQPIKVPGWERPVSETQTKLFGSLMQNYTVGSLLPETPVLSGIVEESLWCPSEEAGEAGRTHPVYFTIWHRILAGVHLSVEEAEERLRTVDRLDLIAWLDEAQRGQRRWMGRYRSLFADIKAWKAHQDKPETDDAEESKFSRLWMIRLPEEILNAPDPLAAILEEHSKKEDDPEDDGLSLFW